MTSQATSAKSAPGEGLPYDAITVNLVRLVGLPKDKARECEAIVRQLLATHGAPARSELPENPIELLDRVRQNFTRDDDLPDDLLPRIDAVIDAAATASSAPLLAPTNRDRCGSGFEQERPTPPLAPSDSRWPETPQDVKDMIGSSFTAAKFVNESDQIGTHSIPAHEMDTYTVTAHDLLEALSHWRDFAACDTKAAAGNRMRGLAEWLRSHAEHGFMATETREAMKSWAAEVDAACRDGDHFGDANEMVDGIQTEPTVELHVPVPLSDKQRGKLLSGVCSLITQNDIPVERVRLVASHDGMAQGRSVAEGAANTSSSLPPLPQPHWPRYYQGAVPSGAFSKDQMHEYARATLATNGLAAPPVNGLAALSDEQLRDALKQSLEATMKRCDVQWHHWRNWAGTWTFATDLVPVVRTLARG